MHVYRWLIQKKTSTSIESHIKPPSNPIKIMANSSPKKAQNMSSSQQARAAGALEKAMTPPGGHRPKVPQTAVFHWGVTIEVSDYDFWGSTSAKKNNKPWIYMDLWHYCGVDITLCSSRYQNLWK